MLNTVLRNTAAKLGFTVIRHSKGNDARELIRELHPVTTRLPLIRAGGVGDGAYLIPDDLEGITAMFSPGVSDRAKFEEEMAARGVTCFLADASVEKPPVDHPGFVFIPKFLGIDDSGIFVTLDSWVKDCAPGDSDLLLQMDIEDAEWGVLANTSRETLRRFRIMVIEFHYMQRLFDSELHRAVMRKLLETHMVVHNHPNNVFPFVTARGIDVPQLTEITFLRRDRAEPTGYASTFPHPLDITNVPSMPSHVLPAGWYR